MLPVATEQEPERKILAACAPADVDLLHCINFAIADSLYFIHFSKSPFSQSLHNLEILHGCFGLRRHFKSVSQKSLPFLAAQQSSCLHVGTIRYSQSQLEHLQRDRKSRSQLSARGCQMASALHRAHCQASVRIKPPLQAKLQAISFLCKAKHGSVLGIRVWS